MPVHATQSQARHLQETQTRKDILILAQLVQIYCRSHHGDREAHAVTAGGTLVPWMDRQDLHLCSKCGSLFLHGAAKRVFCPYDPKPRCKKCPTPCYRPGYREAMRTVMRYSGSRMILRGRIDLLYKYLF